MSLSAREGQHEEERKNRVFAARKAAEDKANKELHYQRLIAENALLKELLKLAKDDIIDWIHTYDKDPKSLEIVERISEFV